MSVLELERSIGKTGTTIKTAELAPRYPQLLTPSERDNDGATGWINMGFPNGPVLLVYQVGLVTHPDGKERIRYLSGVDMHGEISNSFGDPFLGSTGRERRRYEFTYGGYGQRRVRYPEKESWNNHKFIDSRQYAEVENRIAKAKAVKTIYSLAA